MPTETATAEGVTFDHYQVLTRHDGSLHELGRGAMGITYKAFDTNLRVPVALKVINTQALDDQSARERFVQEARLAAKLRHPHVASVFHLGSEGETYFYAMEFIDGETVEALVKRRGPLPALVALRIALQVARALGAAQQHGLVHRDIKPANVMLVSEEQELCAKVIDFGVALNNTVAEDRPPSSQANLDAGGFVGTPHYASPEALEVAEIDVRSDIYSLGATLWYTLSGQPPFTGSVAKVMMQHLTVRPPFEKLQGMAPEIVALLERMLAKSPAERPQSAVELRKEIEACLERAAGGRSAAAEQLAREEQRIVQETSHHRAESPVSEFATSNIVGGRLEVIDQLGETNEGWVFHARDLTAKRNVRLLVLRQDFSQTPEAFTQLQREVERLASAEHPNLLRVYGLETLGTRAVVVLEWTQGVTLREVLRVRRELPASEIVPLLKQLAEGIDYAVSFDVRQLDLALHQVFVHVPDLAEVPEALLLRPLTEWPKHRVKLNPLSITRELSVSETWAGGQTIVKDVEAMAAHAGGASLGALYTRMLALLMYELLGGAIKPVVAAAGGSTRYTPLANLTEEGNEVMRRALDPARAFVKADDFLRALLNVDQLESRRTDLGSASRTQSGTIFAGQTVGLPMAVPRKKTRLPMALAAAGVVLLLGAIFFFTRPKTSPPVSEPVSVQTPEPAPAPVPVPVPEPPPPPPDPRALLNAAVAEAQKVEDAGDLGKSLAQWLQVAKNFPDAEIGRMRLELLLDGLRLRQQKLSVADLAKLSAPLQEAAGLGVGSAMLLLAESSRGRDPEAAFKWYSAAAEKGIPSALTQVGLLYSNGAGVNRDLTKATEYFEQGAAKGDASAKYALAECLLIGKGVEKNPERAIELLQQAVSEGNILAMDRLGTCYHQGIGVPKNFREAMRMYQRAADLNHGPAMGNLGVLYIKGEGVPPNPRKAMQLFQKGAQAEDAFCMFLYAQCLEAGTGITANPAEAQAWYKRAAEAGMRKAQEWCRENRVPFKERAGS